MLKKPIIDHIQITVQSLENVEQFYDQLMPLLGFDLNKKSKGSVAAHDFHVIEYVHPELIFAINSPREGFKDNIVHRRIPGSIHHLAFKATSEQEVDQFYQELLKTEANIVNPPQLYPQHGEYYYALFFKDPDGIKYELVFEKR